MSADIAKLIEQGNWEAVEQAEKGGPSTIDTIKPYLNDADDVIRLCAIDCIVVAGGPQAPGLLIQALSDTSEQVRINAVNGLHKQLPVKNKQNMLKAWDSSKDNYVRQQIPMVLGRMADDSLIPELKNRMDSVSNPQVRDGFVAGLSKLGYEPARSEFASLLKAARGERVKDMIDYVQYIDDPWVLLDLRPVMDRHEEAIDMSSHRTTIKRRGCDLATDEVIRISQQPFSFNIDPIGQYKDTQLKEVIHFLDTLTKKP